jgi:hypothetical protein
MEYKTVKHIPYTASFVFIFNERFE